MCGTINEHIYLTKNHVLPAKKVFITKSNKENINIS